MGANGRLAVMQTIPEAMGWLSSALNSGSPAVTESFRELLGEPELLRLAMSIADQPQEGTNAKVMRALCLGILIGIQSGKE